MSALSTQPFKTVVFHAFYLYAPAALSTAKPHTTLRRCSAFVRSLGGVLAETLLHFAVVCAVVLRSGEDVYLAQRVAAHFLKRFSLAYRVAVCVSVDLNSAVKLFLREV